MRHLSDRATLREILDERPEDQHDVPESGEDHDCNDHLYEAAPATRLSPAEYGCAVCDGEA